MKLGGFKIGKSKEKTVPQDDTGEEIAKEIPDIQEDDIPVRHHAPLQELSLDNAGAGEAPDVMTTVEEPAPEEDSGAVKLVEVKVDPGAVSVEAKKEEEKLDINTTISNVFNAIEDEENPLANLMKSLPEVAATELLDDLKEINDIIKDWQKK